MRTDAERLALLHGTTEAVRPLRPLRAGPLELLLDGIDLRYVRIGSTELLRRVYTAVRDSDWRTVPAVVSGLSVDEHENGFRIEFDARHVDYAVDFAWHGTITGDEHGRLEYIFDGRAERAFPYGRIGICLHHPWRETAGARFVARTPDGRLEGVFPDLVGQQPYEDGSFHALFAAFDQLEVALDGGTVVFDFEGDLWETEDHRNWTDANFKTYSTPLALGPPTPLGVGGTLRQRVVMTPVDVPPGTPHEGSHRLSIGGPTGTRFPLVGLGADRDLHRPNDHETALLTALGLHHLRADVRLDRGSWRATLESAQETARSIGAGLELALMVRPEDAAALDEVAGVLEAGPNVEQVLVTAAGAGPRSVEQTTPAGLVDLVRTRLAGAIPGATFVGGTEMYFAELNRVRPEPACWDGVCYSISPQIHAFTDIDVVENLDAQAETVRSARVLGRDRDVIVSPITLAPRRNFYAADLGDGEVTVDGALPPSVDPRQSSLYGAAWTAGSLKYLAESGVRSATYYESTGWRGVLGRAAGTPLPELFVLRPGCVFPLYHPLADACEWVGADVLACSSTNPLAVVALAVRTPKGSLRLLVANMTHHALDVDVEGIAGPVRIRRLDETTAGLAASDPAAFRAGGEDADAHGTLTLTLAADAVVRVDTS